MVLGQIDGPGRYRATRLLPDQGEHQRLNDQAGNKGGPRVPPATHPLATRGTPTPGQHPINSSVRDIVQSGSKMKWPWDNPKTPCPEGTDTGGTWIGNGYPDHWTGSTCAVQGSDTWVLGHITTIWDNRQPVVKTGP